MFKKTSRRYAKGGASLSKRSSSPLSAIASSRFGQKTQPSIQPKVLPRVLTGMPIVRPPVPQTPLLTPRPNATITSSSTNAATVRPLPSFFGNATIASSASNIAAPSYSANVSPTYAGNLSMFGSQFGMKKGGKVSKNTKPKKQAEKISGASKRGDGIAQRGKTRGRIL